jgi:hypothetical protein
MVLPVLILCTWLGFAYGAPPTVAPDARPPNWLELWLANRLLACIAQIGIGVMLHLWIGPKPSARQLPQDMFANPTTSFDE